MKSGRLRHKVEFQNKVVLRDSMGGETVTWVAFTHAWASVEPLSGREYFASRQTQAMTSHKMTMRYQSGIRPYHRIQWAGRVFNIDAILNENEANKSLIIYCTEAI